MYEIQIESEEFKEKRTVQQHQMVNQVSTSNKAPLPLISSILRGPDEWGGYLTVSPRNKYYNAALMQRAFRT